MQIVIVGATGTIGTAVTDELAERHTLIKVGRHKGDLTVDIENPESIQEMYRQTGKIDAVISAVGSIHFGTLTEMTADHFAIGLKSKLMGQVNLVLMGIPFLKDGGSFTLTSGSASYDPYRYGSSPAMVNGAIDSFVAAASLELPRGIRINAVSPTILEESMKEYGQYFRGFTPVPAKKVALAYSKSVEGLQTGRVYRVGEI